MNLSDQSDVVSMELEDFGEGRFIKETQSLCPQCLAKIPAQVYARDGQVWMDKRCPEHGPYSALLAADERHYYERPTSGLKDSGPSCCGPVGGCGPAPAADEDQSSIGAPSSNNPVSNHSCNILLEITERCNLTCPTCYAGSSPYLSKMMGLEAFTRQVDALVAMGKRDTDVIQLSGGEPTIHPQLITMLHILRDKGFVRICINTNGIKLANAEFVERLSTVDGIQLSFYLQFDGFDEATHAQLRGRDDLLKVKEKALQHLLAKQFQVHPVMTLTRGVNDHEVGRFIQLALDYPQIKDVIIQPAMYSGRYDNPRRIDRLTLADTVALITEQNDVFSAEDFGPIPCSDPNCFGMAMALRTDAGLIPVSRFFPQYQQWQDEQNKALIESVSDTINAPTAVGEIIRWATTQSDAARWLAQLSETEVEQLLDLFLQWNQTPEQGRKALWDRLLMVNIKPFMDAYTYDQDRIDQCCVHILSPEGQPISFCEYNAVQRPLMMAADAARADS